MRVNSGGGPRPDDDGLPAIDVQVPDDASELDRDVQAYYRELRALRRQERLRRALRPLARDGLVLPLLAGCLALTLLAGALLTVFTAGETTGGSPAATGPAGHNPGTAARGQQRPPSMSSRTLPPGIVSINGQAEPLTNLAGSVLVLALIPAGCQCLAGLRELKSEAGKAGATAYLVGLGSAGTQVSALARSAGLASSRAVADSSGALARQYHPAGLTTVVVRPDRSIAQVLPGTGGRALLPLLRSLVRASAQPG
jgi:hypothetical protein